MPLLLTGAPNASPAEFTQEIQACQDPSRSCCSQQIRCAICPPFISMIGGDRGVREYIPRGQRLAYGQDMKNYSISFTFPAAGAELLMPVSTRRTPDQYCCLELDPEFPGLAHSRLKLGVHRVLADPAQRPPDDLRTGGRHARHDQGINGSQVSWP